jgi:RHS repeat-associated protein
MSHLRSLAVAIVFFAIAPVVLAQRGGWPEVAVTASVTDRKDTHAVTATSLPEDVRRISRYSPELQLLAETERSTAAVPPEAHEYIWFGGQPVAQLDAAGTVSWYFNDHLGTPILQANASGQVVWRAEYEPYGEVHAFRAGASKHQPLRLPGQESDGTTETSYNIFRWYRAGWGRYTQSDPLGLVPTIFGIKNLYGYADANPIDHADPLGLYSIDPGCSDTCGPDNVTSCYANPQKINCIKGLIEEMKQKVFHSQPCRKALQAAGKWQQVAGSLMPSAPYPKITCNKADCNGSEPKYFPVSQSIPMCKWFFSYSPPAGAQSMLHEFLHNAGIGDGTAEQTNILTACFPGMAP